VSYHCLPAKKKSPPKPWFSVRENDVFPEEFPHFLGLRPDLREALLTSHGDLFAPQAWQRLQTALRAGAILEVFPYHAGKRLTRKNHAL
jgi:isocitrate dehydrogenase kinase/phosphatase